MKKTKTAKRPPPVPDEAARLLTTPELAVHVFLLAWQEQQWPGMFAACQWTWKANNAHYRERLLKNWFGPRRLLSWEVQKEYERNMTQETVMFGKPIPEDCCRDFFVKVRYEAQGEGGALQEFTPVLRLRVISEGAPYTPAVIPPASYWGVNPLTALDERAAAENLPPLPFTE